MITIKSISMVVPSEPTPNGLLQLSESDQVAQWTHAPIIHIYRPNNTNNTIPFSFETMKDSLSHTLVHFYPLAGRLHWIEGGRLELDCNAIGVQLLEAYSEGTLDELALSHTMVDGQSATNFISSWAKLARGDNLEDHEMPFLDRTVLRSSEPLMLPRFDHIEYTTKPPLLIGSTDANEEKNKETSVTLLKLTKEQVEGLKKRANQEMGVTIRPYTRYEAIAGHMWRCACKVRVVDNIYDQPTRVRLGLDIRNRLKPALPQRYFGNAIFGTVTSTCLYGDLLSKPLSYSAGKLREAIERMTDEYIRSILDFMTSQKHVGGLRCNFHIRGNTEGIFLGNPNLSLDSWLNLPFYDLDFGWGKPVYVGPGLLNMDGKSFIMPSPAFDGSLIIALRLQTQYIDSFKKIFYEDIK
uniref:Spermidine hydroxycinnamoyl transferase n=1 Tax=Fagus sylvatica TaxID=28930 RepID=A0A2N9IMY2_FAGSY